MAMYGLFCADVPMEKLSMYQVWARGSCDDVPHFSTVNSWWPLLP